MEHKTCPFCGVVHEFKPWLNIICTCGAKYYFMDKLWLDRKTGEIMFDLWNSQGTTE